MLDDAAADPFAGVILGLLVIHRKGGMQEVDMARLLCIDLGTEGDVVRHALGRTVDPGAGQAVERAFLPVGGEPVLAEILAQLFHDITEARSEAHTSELQSLMRSSYPVFCLKKNKHSHSPTTTQHYAFSTPISTL